MKETELTTSRRNFLKSMAVAGLGSVFASPSLMPSFPQPSTKGKLAEREVTTPLLSERTPTASVNVEDCGQAFVEASVRCGIKYWFINSGTDWPAFLDATAKRMVSGEKWPKVWVVPHEFVATSMAHGYTMVSDEPSLVGYHVTVGIANAVGAIINAYTARVPIVLFGGKRSWTVEGMPGSAVGPIGQEVYDQGGLVRQYVKYDYEFKVPQHIPQVLHRALQIAQTAPKGPVYLMFPKELSLMKTSDVKIQPCLLYTSDAADE